jgi:hypothetical protein
MNGSGFLWVSDDHVKAARTVSRRDIASFVQKRRRRPRAIINSSAQSLVGWQRRPSRDSVSNAEEDVQGLNHSSSLPSRISSLSLSGSGSIDSRTAKSPDAQDELQLISSQSSDRDANLPSIRPPPDSYTIGTLFNDKVRRILYYFNTVWMPSEKAIPAFCHLGGFSPVWHSDAALSEHILRESLHTPDDVHLNSLLAASVARMRFVSGFHVEKGTEPEVFVVKAIQALRHAISAGQPVENRSRLVLDIAYLTLPELYGSSPTRSSVYWKLMRDSVIACGGFNNMAPHHAFISVAIDLLVSEATLTFPAFDFVKYPGLLGLSRPFDNMEQIFTLEYLIWQETSPGESRVRSKAAQTVLFSCVLKLIHCLPAIAFTKTKLYVRKNLARMWAFTTAAAQPHHHNQPPSSSPIALTADIFSMRARETAYAIWIWHIAASFCPVRPYLANYLSILPSGVALYVSNACNQTYEYLSSAEDLFGQTDWQLRDDIKFWISAVGVLVSETDELRAQYSASFSQACRNMRIHSREELTTMFKKPSQLPLDRIARYGTDRLFDLIPVSG